MPVPALSSSMSFRITRLVVLLVLATAALAALAALRPIDRQMKRVAGDQAFTLLKAAAAALDHRIASRQALLRGAAERLGAQAGQAQAPSKLLAANTALRGEFSSVLLFDAAGRVVAGRTDPAAPAATDAGMEGRLRALFRDGTGTAFLLAPGAKARRPQLWLVEPVRDAAGQLRYALAASIDPQGAHIGEQLQAIGLGVRGYFYIADLAGNIVHHPDQRRIMARLPPVGLEGWLEGPDERGEPALLAYKRLRTLPWLGGAVHPVDDAFAGLDDARAEGWFAASLVAIAAGIFGLAAALRMLRPLDELVCRVRALAPGDLDLAALDTGRQAEVGELSRGLFAVTQQCAAAEERLARLAFTDALTGIANRRMLEEALAAALARGRRSCEIVAVAYLDIDRFKSINDTMGHMCGDAVLVDFAARLKGAVRSHDTVARLAGDEFMVVLDGVGGVADAADAAKRILDSFRTPFLYGGRSVPVTASVGIALQHPQDECAPAELIGRADAALYRAKHDGRNRYAVDGGADPAPGAISRTAFPAASH